MKNLHDIIQKNMEEFDEKYTWQRLGYMSNVASDMMVKELKSHLLSSQLSIIQAIDEMIDEVIKNKEQVNGFQPYHKCSDNCGEPCWLAGNERKVFFDGFDDGRAMMKIDLMKIRSFLEEAKN
jgi:hypothetical protein